MEQALEAKLEQDKEIIQAVTKQEMRKALLRNKINAMRNCREPLNSVNQAVDKDGDPIKGRRKFQEYYVTEKQIMHQVMKRLNIPKDELAILEAEADKEATKATSEQEITEHPEPVDPDKPAEAEDECLMVGQEDDTPIERIQPARRPIQGPRVPRIIRPVEKVEPKIAPVRKPMDEVDRALAELDKAERKKAQTQKQKNKKISTKAKHGRRK